MEPLCSCHPDTALETKIAPLKELIAFYSFFPPWHLRLGQSVHIPSTAILLSILEILE